MSSDTEQYTLGYGPASIAMMSVRTVENHAAFFIEKLSSGMRVLDVGCGPGTITIGIAEVVYPGLVTGIELDLEQTQLVASQIKECDVNLSFELADVYSLPYLDGEFDAIFSSALIGNLQRPIEALKEIHRVLKPGGVIGIKEFDHSANIVYPQADFQIRVYDLYNQLRLSNGHDPDSGRKIKSYLNTVGFDQIRAIAMYHTTEPVPGKGSPLLEAMIRDEWGPAFIAKGWVTQDEVDGWIHKSMNHEYGKDIFAATAWIEATAYRTEDGKVA